MTFKGLIKTVIALVIIGAAVAIGWAVATATNPYNSTSAATSAPAVAQANQGQGAARPTPIPTFTPSTNSGTGSSTTPGAGGQAQGNTGATGTGTGGQGGFQRTAPVTGTVSSYDTGNKILTVKDASGKDQQFDASNARVTKTEKLASADFSSALGNNAIVLLTGTKGSDGTYTATSLMVVDATAFGGGTGGTGGFGGRAGANGTPGANGAAPSGTPGAGGTGTGRGNAGGFGGAAGFGGANGGVIIRQATLQGNKLTGTDATGQAITATVSDSTVLEKQAAGTADDLKAGANVSIVSRPATADAPPQAITITLS